MVEMLLKHGAEVDKIDWLNKFTPLHLAIKEGTLIMVYILLSLAEINLRSIKQ